MRAYGARCDGATDDAAAIQRAEAAAARAATASHPTVVRLPAGTCAVGAAVAWDSNVALDGAGMSSSTLRALPGFTYDPSLVRTGPDGKQIGMVWLDGPTATAAISGVTIENLTFDPRAGTQHWSERKGIRLFYPVVCYMRPVQHLTIQHVAFELGANPSAAYVASGTEGAKAFVGVSLTHLGVDPKVPSHDLVFNDVHAHNGDGTFRLVLDGSTENGATSRLYNVTVTNEYDVVDMNYLEDDRFELDGGVAPLNAPLKGAPLGDIANLTFRNVNVSVSPTVSIGSVNAIRLNAWSNAEIHHVAIDGVNYTGSPAGYVSETIVPMHDGTGSVTSMNGSDVQGYLNDIEVSDVQARYTIGVGVTLGAPPGEPLSADVRNVVVHDAFVYGGVGLTFMTPKPSVHRANGPYDVTLTNIQVDGSPNNATQPSLNPIGIDVHSHLPSAGDGALLLEDVTATGFVQGLWIDPGYDGAVLDDVHWSNGATIRSHVVLEDGSGPL